ncbi:MAG: hypothetical protein LBK54_06735 [Propionibacteriaceae bacterium]|jgi:hypothetical protein|nr:hypothetical protein [Propionibacteriaceae bacterium]
MEYPEGSWEQILSDWWEKGAGDQVVGEAAPGLPRCASRIEGVAEERVLGWGTRFPRTLEGAVAASAEAVKFFLSVDYFTDAIRDVVYQPLMGRSAPSEGTVQRWQTMFAVDGLGRPVDGQGQPVLEQQMFAATYPEYGAYRLLWTNLSPLGNVEEAFISWWAPYVVGHGTDSDMSDVRVAHVLFTVVMSWGGDDWVVGELTFDSSSPKPPERPPVNLSFVERSRLLAAMGDGWCVPADGIESRRPGVPLAQDI